MSSDYEQPNFINIQNQNFTPVLNNFLPASQSSMQNQDNPNESYDYNPSKKNNMNQF